MKQKLVFLIVFTVMSSACTCLASPQSLSCEGRAAFMKSEGEKKLQQVQESYTNVSSISASFLQRSYLSALEISEVSNGVVEFLRPGKMKWHYQSPEEQIFLMNDNTFWFYQVEDRQVTIHNADQILISDVPVAFLSGLGNINDDFNVASVCKRDEGILFQLTPKTSEEEVSEFALLVDSEKFLPLGAEVTDASGNKTAIFLQGRKVNEGVSVGAFGADFPKSIDIIDERRN